LPGDIVIGRWWRNSPAQVEVDVLGLQGGRTALVGEAKWDANPLGSEALGALRRKLEWVPDPAEQVQLALWGGGGVTRDVLRQGVLGFDAGDVIP
jgi:hypothetical protein